MDSGNFNAEPGRLEALRTDAAWAQAKANVKVAGYGAAVVGADELVKRQLPEDEPGEEQGTNPGPPVKPQKPPPFTPQGHDMADAYAANFNMLYGNDADGRMYPWS